MASKGNIERAHGFHMDDMFSFDINPIFALMTLVVIPVFALGVFMKFFQPLIG